MLLSNNIIIASLFAIASTYVNAASLNTSHPWTKLTSEDNFCMFLPPHPGLVVAVNENNGIPFCTKKGTVPHDTVFPTGFITTAHYLKTSEYAQVTGFFDRTKYHLGANDGGGQYDNHAHGKPVSAQCEGYNYFVNLIEPDVERFCIRCCQNKVDCNTGRSGYGCLRVVAGDYERNNNMISGDSSASKSSTKKTTTHHNANLNSVYYELNDLNTSNDDKTVDDASTSTDANQEILTEAQALQKNVSTNQITADQIQTQWSSFSSQLVTDFPNVADQIQQLNAITTGLTSIDQWDAFFSLVSERIIQLQQNNSDTNDASAITDTSDNLTTSHTDNTKDLEWLFSHRNSHDNQATW